MANGGGGATKLLVDPVTYELVRNTILAISTEMAMVVSKSAYSTAINEGMDFANATYDRRGKLLAQGEFDLPAFVGITMLAVPEVVRAIGLENMEPGDIYMINDPYVASTHCNDISFIKPVFYEGEIVAFLSSTAHWTDVGGVVPGSLNLSAKTHFEEGMRIPAVTIVKRGQLQDDLVRLLLANVRQTWERVGDLNAQIAALNTGDGRVQELVAKRGVASTLAAFQEMQNHTERLVRAAFRSIPDGVYEAEDLIDQDLATGEPVAIRLKMTIEGDHVIYDLTESDDAAGSAINGTIAATTSSVYNATGAILPPMPMNSGLMRAIEIKTRKGSICHAQPPVAISGTAATSLECTFAAVVKALSAALPERGAGISSTMHNTMYSGVDERGGLSEPFIEYIWAAGGMGGTKYKDGGNTVGSPYGATIRNIPVELQERRYPVLWSTYMLLQDSGGPGRSRGGLALTQECGFPFQPGRLNSFGNRERFGPPGDFRWRRRPDGGVHPQPRDGARAADELFLHAGSCQSGRRTLAVVQRWGRVRRCDGAAGGECGGGYSGRLCVDRRGARAVWRGDQGSGPPHTGVRSGPEGHGEAATGDASRAVSPRRA